MMENKVRHVLGISGGKDSAALAIYLKENYPALDIDYYFCDTGKELDETYQLIDKLQVYLGKKIEHINSTQGSTEDPFDHFLKLFGGYLPSSNSRWCTRKLKLEPFENWVGNDPVISYVGIRGDEDREGYISTKTNIQSIFPFRKNIWSEDVVAKVLKNDNISLVQELYSRTANKGEKVSERINDYILEKITPKFTLKNKLHSLLDLDIKAFNKAVFAYLKQTTYPLAYEADFPLITNDEVLVRDDIFATLRGSGVGVPKYYEKLEYQTENGAGEYARSRSGCYFCFFQQKIEWIWLYEQHPELFTKAMEYEKDGYTWIQDEKLSDLIAPDRMKQIKENHLKRTNRTKEKTTSPYLLDILDDTEGEGCAACFI